MVDHYLLKVQEVADAVRFSPDTILKAIHNGQLKAQRVGQRPWRIRQPDFDDWVTRGMPTDKRPEAEPAR